MAECAALFRPCMPKGVGQWKSVSAFRHESPGTFPSKKSRSAFRLNGVPQAWKLLKSYLRRERASEIPANIMPSNTSGSDAGSGT